MGNKRLFVMIDDDIDDHEIFQMAIDELNEPLQCQFFADCESAITHFSENSASPPGYVFIDLRLPRIDGDQCLQELQKLKQFDHPLLVVYSSSIPEEFRNKLVQIGVDEFVEKTGSIQLLAGRIQRLLTVD
ncbi:response regulator [Dyadobacter chenwenxiniae]|uniref:Response regulator n=1 Tax=Dyadobacter chenwenxiniae TaxID=2906456 RepID=A0A9X1PRP7_9BACT|nr:response regulator [Dyadobacter chenwenxiniae]MCF0064428.1 response regulator [Dyadobacter chenwenxiniae]UON82367.1 response regulator [Dyadobacter chenwenxiniae]